MLRRFPVRVQLTAIIAFTSAVSLAVAFTAFFLYDLSAFKQKLARDMRGQAEIIGKNSTGALSFGDAEVAQEVLDSLKARPDIEVAALYTKEGDLLAKFQRPGLGGTTLPMNVLSTETAFLPDALETLFVIRMGSDRVGGLYILSNMEEWKERRQRYLAITGAFTALALAAAALVGAYLQRTISGPILRLASAMERVKENRDYGSRVEDEGRDEISDLVAGYNGMLAEIMSREEELQRTNDELDVRVQQRTAELETEIAERIAAQEELQASQRQLSDFFENAPMGLNRVDEKGTILAANKAELELYGYAAEQYVGRNITEFAATPTAMKAALARLVDGETLSNFETDIKCKDGSTKTVQINANVLWENGRFVHARLFTLDITLVRRAQEAQRDKEKAERANQAKNEFLSRMSHELRTPMNSILGFGQLLEMEELQPRQKECVTHILKGGRHLLSLINEVLNISRIESGTISLSLEGVPLSDVVRETVDLVNPLAVQRNINLHAHLGDFAQTSITADRQRINQVMINLLSNGVKYNTEGGEVAVTVEQAANNRVRIVVQDTGPGIPDDMVERLFIPFDRLGAEQSSVEGTGLGLSLSKTLVEAMGGDLLLDTSFAGPGSRFVVELPIADSQENQSSPEVRFASAVPVRPGSERTVLVIEDNMANVKLLEQLIADRKNLRMLVAMQGSLGLEFAVKHRPDIILLDVNLPDMNGDEVARKIRENAELAKTPILVISADATEHAKKKFEDLDIYAYFTKPINVRQFIETLDGLTGEEMPLSA